MQKPIYGEKLYSNSWKWCIYTVLDPTRTRACPVDKLLQLECILSSNVERQRVNEFNECDGKVSTLLPDLHNAELRLYIKHNCCCLWCCCVWCCCCCFVNCIVVDTVVVVITVVDVSSEYHIRRRKLREKWYLLIVLSACVDGRFTSHLKSRTNCLLKVERNSMDFYWPSCIYLELTAIIILELAGKFF